jgi:O-acetylhomoserine (thiol)-lyase
MSDAKKTYGFATQAIHSGLPTDPAFGSPVPPIYQSVSFEFPTAQSASDRFHLREFGQIYSRLTNPTTDALEARLAALEGGTGAVVAASGHAAQMLALLPLVAPGDHILASSRLYGGTTSQLLNTFPQHFGWTATLTDPDNLDNFKRSLTEKTKVIFVEALANPGGVIVDIEGMAKIAHEAGIPLIVDNTMATPYLLRPLDYGADVVTYSTTKFLTGNGTSLGGALIDGGKFDWAKTDKFPALTAPCSAYHGMKLYETFGNMALTIHAKAIGLRDLGPTQQPLNAFLTLLGLETLAVRMERHVQNAQKVAEWLEKQPQVESVSYAGLKSSPYHALAQKYMKRGAGSVFTFTIKGNLEEAKAFIEALDLFTFVANIGDTRSLIIHPASTTHSQLTKDQLAKANIKDGTMRVSIGLEDAEDIIADLDQALKAYPSAVKKVA